MPMMFEHLIDLLVKQLAHFLEQRLTELGIVQLVKFLIEQWQLLIIEVELIQLVQSQFTIMVYFEHYLVKIAQQFVEAMCQIIQPQLLDYYFIELHLNSLVFVKLFTIDLGSFKLAYQLQQPIDLIELVEFSGKLDHQMVAILAIQQFKLTHLLVVNLRSL